MHDCDRISAKLSKFRPSLTLELKRLAGERLQRGLPVYDFGLGETKGELADRIREAGERAYREGQTMYGDPAGLPELRQAVLRWLNQTEHYGLENVVISTGAKQSLFNIFLAVCNPADTVLFDAAPWVSYQPLAISSYASPIMVLPRAGPSNHLKVSAEDLRRNLRMRPHAKLFLLNSPFIVEQAAALADRCLSMEGDDTQRIEWAIQSLYGRDPYPQEVELALEFLVPTDELDHAARWQQYAQVLLCSNELMFVD